MNWYIFSDDVFSSSALTDMPEHDDMSEPHDQSTATAIITCTPESEYVALEKKRKIAPLKTVLWAFYTSIQSKQDDLYRSSSREERKDHRIRFL